MQLSPGRAQRANSGGGRVGLAQTAKKLGDVIRDSDAPTQATPAERLAASRATFYSLNALTRALDVTQGPGGAEAGIADPMMQVLTTQELREAGEACVESLLALIGCKSLELTKPFVSLITQCFCQLFERCESLNMVNAILDMQAVAEAKKATVGARIAAVTAQGALARTAGIRMVSLLPSTSAALGRQAKSSEPHVRVAALLALRDLVDGASAFGAPINPEVVRVCVRACADRCPEARAAAAAALAAVGSSGSGGLGGGGSGGRGGGGGLWASGISGTGLSPALEAVLAPIVKGLDDESPGVRLAMAEATGAVLAAAVDGAAAERDRRGVIAARDQDQDDTAEATAARAVAPQSQMDKLSARFREMSQDMKVSVGKLSDKKLPAIAPTTLDNAILILSELFRRATFPTLTSRDYMSGIAAAFVVLLRGARHRITAATVPAVIRSVLELLDSDRLPQNGNEACAVRTAVEYVLHDGVCARVPEGIQLAAARELIMVLSEVVGSSPPAAGFAPLLNEHQLQVCLVELSHLTHALGQACAALKDSLVGCLCPLLGHASYGVRFEAAVGLTALGNALPFFAAGLLSRCLQDMARHRETLLAPAPAAAGGEAAGVASVVAVAAAAALADDVTAAGDDAEEGAEAAVAAAAGGTPRMVSARRAEDAAAAMAAATMALAAGGSGAMNGMAANAAGKTASEAASSSAAASAAAVVAAAAAAPAGAPGGIGGNTPPGRRADKGQDKRFRMFALHGNGAAASMLLQVGPELPLGIPPAIMEQAVAVAHSLISVQFPEIPAREASAQPTSEGAAAAAAAVAAAMASVDVSSQGMGVVCTCVRTGWGLMAALFCQGPRWAAARHRQLFDLWEQSIKAARDGQAGQLARLEQTHELIFLDAAMRALLCYTRSCPETLYTVEGCLPQTVRLMEGAMAAVEGRLKSPAKTQGIICRTLLKAMLMESFAWLPPGCFPGTCEKLFQWSLDHLRMYTANDVEASLLPVLVNPDDAVLDMGSTTRVPVFTGVSSPVDGEETDAFLAMHALVCGIPIGHQERDAMVGSANIWARKQYDQHMSSKKPTPLHNAYWRQPAPSSSSINVRLLDAAITVFAATFGHQDSATQVQAVEGLSALLPDAFRATPSGGAAMFNIKTTPAALTDQERRKRDRRQHLSVGNVTTALLAALQSLPTYEDSRYNVDLPWVGRCRDVLLDVLAAPSATVRRAAAEAIALMGLKVGDGFAVYLVQALLEVLRRKDKDPRKAAMDKDPVVALNRRAGAIFALACLKRDLGNQVLLSWFWTDIQKALAVGGDVPQPVRTWGLHSVAILVKTMEDNPTLYSQVQETLTHLQSVVNMLEAHFLGSWNSATITAKASSQSAAARESQALSADEPGLVVAQARLLCTLLPLLQSLRPSSALVGRFVGVWGVLSGGASGGGGAGPPDSRSTRHCLDFVQLLAMFAPQDLLPALGRVMPVVQRVLASPEDASCDCIAAAAACLKLIASKSPAAIQQYCAEIELFGCLEKLLGGSVWEGAPFWRGIVLSRDVERHYSRRHLAAQELKVAIETIVAVDQGGYRPIHWLLFGRALLIGTSSAGGGGNAAGQTAVPAAGAGDTDWEGGGDDDGGGGHHDDVGGIGATDGGLTGGGDGVEFDADFGTDFADFGSGDGADGSAAGGVGGASAARKGVGSGCRGGKADGSSGRLGTLAVPPGAIADWHGACQAARRALSELAAPLASVRWQVKWTATSCCLMALKALGIGGASPHDGGKGSSSASARDKRLTCLDMAEARRAVNRAVHLWYAAARRPSIVGAAVGNGSLAVMGGGAGVGALTWQMLPQFACLYVDDLISTACTAATASTDDSELLELQEAGVRLLITVVQAFAAVPDPDTDQAAAAMVGGRTVAVAPRTLQQSISQITSAARPALQCKVSPSLVVRGCELVAVLLCEGLVEDPVVVRRLIRQVMPVEVGGPASPPPLTKGARRNNKFGLMTAAAAATDSAAVVAAAVAPTPASALQKPLRPPASMCFGAHVPLVERLARLHTLALIYLASIGRNGSGGRSGGVVTDAGRATLAAALREAVPELSRHWVAVVADAARLQQGENGGVWPRLDPPGSGAGLVYGPGVGTAIVKLHVLKNWPTMAAAAAHAIATEPWRDDHSFLVSISVCGLLGCGGALGRGRGGAAAGGAGSVGSLRYHYLDGASGDEDEQDEATAAVATSITLLAALEGLLRARTLAVAAAGAVAEAAGAEGRGGAASSFSLPSAPLPLSAAVDILSALQSGPFLRIGGGNGSAAGAGGGGGGGAAEFGDASVATKELGGTAEVQVATVRMLTALMSEPCATYFNALKAADSAHVAGPMDAAGTTAAAAITGTAPEMNGGSRSNGMVAHEADDKSALWTGLLVVIVGSVCRAVPDLVRPEDVQNGSAAPVNGGSRGKGTVTAASLASVSAVLPLLELMPTFCPPAQAAATLPALAQLSLRLLESVVVVGSAIGGDGYDAAAGSEKTMYADGAAAVAFLLACLVEVRRRTPPAPAKNEAAAAADEKSLAAAAEAVVGGMGESGAAAECTAAAKGSAAAPEDESRQDDAVAAAPAINGGTEMSAKGDSPGDGSSAVADGGVTALDGDAKVVVIAADDSAAAESAAAVAVIAADATADGSAAPDSSAAANDSADINGSVAKAADEIEAAATDDSAAAAATTGGDEGIGGTSVAAADGDEGVGDSTAVGRSVAAAANGSGKEGAVAMVNGANGDAGSAAGAATAAVEGEDNNDDWGDNSFESAPPVVANAVELVAEGSDAEAAVPSTVAAMPPPLSAVDVDEPDAATKLAARAGEFVNRLLGAAFASARDAEMSPAAPAQVEGRLSAPLRMALSAEAAECGPEARRAALAAARAVLQRPAPPHSPHASEAALRCLTPHVLDALRCELARPAVAPASPCYYHSSSLAASAAAGGSGSGGSSSGGADEWTERRQACLGEAIKGCLLVFTLAPPLAQAPLLALVLPLLAATLRLPLPALHALVGQAGVHLARAAPAAFREGALTLGPEDRGLLEGAVRVAVAAAEAQAPAAAAPALAARRRMKLDLSQYKR